MSARQNAPVVIRRKKVVSGGGHHGGAWKVAYADFVTAMMAFFMLMWLLNATTEKQRKGIADYFSPTIPINRISGGGDGSFGGDSVFSEQTLARNGNGASSRHPTKSNAARGNSGVDPGDKTKQTDDQTFQSIEEQLTGRSGESMVRQGVLRHIETRVTDEGLIVELFDTPDSSLFAANSIEPEPILNDLLSLVAEVFSLAENDIAVRGFTRAQPIVVAQKSGWALSSGRADRVRESLVRSGLPAERFQRQTGYADRVPKAKNPMAPRNNRIELVLLRRTAEP